MEIDNAVSDGTGATSAEFPGSGKSTGFENLKNTIADAIHKSADALGKKSADQDAQSSVAHYGKQASEWLDQSADYVRQFDYKQTDAKVREYIGQSPGRSLLIAGAVGLIIGGIWRRR